METNGTLFSHVSPTLLEKIEVWSMDIKLPSATGLDLWEAHERFFAALQPAKTIILKVILTPTTLLSEMETLWNVFQNWKRKRENITLIFQPMTHKKAILSGDALSWAYEKVLSVPDGSVRILPQIHPLLNIR
jgi:hypothetical protein